MSLLEIDGRATFSALSAKKEGKGDSKVLTVDLKLNIITSNEVLIHFHPQLRLMLFDKDGKPRFPLMGAVPWAYEFPNQYVEIHPDVQRPLLLHACRLKNFDFFAMDSGKVRVGFSAHVQPNNGDFEVMGKILAESVRLKIRNDNLDLFGEKKADPQRPTLSVTVSEPELPLEVASAGAASTIETERVAAAIALVTSTRKASISYVQRQLKLTYNEAALLLEELERVGVVSPVKANGVRDVLAPNPADLESADMVPAVNPAGTPLGIRLNKRDHPVGSVHEDGGIIYDVTGQGDKTITLAARPALELSEEMLAAMREAGKAEAKKEEDDRDFDTGFVSACQAAKLPRAFVDENLVELQAAFTDGFEEEGSAPEGA